MAGVIGLKAPSEVRVDVVDPDRPQPEFASDTAEGTEQVAPVPQAQQEQGPRFRVLAD